MNKKRRRMSYGVGYVGPGNRVSPHIHKSENSFEKRKMLLNNEPNYHSKKKELTEEEKQLKSKLLKLKIAKQHRKEIFSVIFSIIFTLIILYYIWSSYFSI